MKTRNSKFRANVKHTRFDALHEYEKQFVFVLRFKSNAQKTKRNDVIQMSLTYENAIARKNARRARLINSKTRNAKRIRTTRIARHIERAYVAQIENKNANEFVREIENALIELLH